MQVSVGVGVLIFKNGKVLLGKRKGSLGASTWGLPGGHLEAGESIEVCAARETMEETNLTVGSFSNVGFTNTVFADELKHYVTLFVLAAESTGEPIIMEPDKCDAWQWFDWSDMPEPLFGPFKSLLEQGYQPPGTM